MNERTFGRHYGQEQGDEHNLTPADGIIHKEQRWEDMPHEDLVAIIKNSVERAREDWEQKWGEGSFDPVIWMGEKLTGKSLFKGADKSAMRLSLAWDALTQPYIKDPEYKDIIRGIIRDSSRTYGRHVTLEPKGVKLLDAMAEAINVPRPRSERKIDLFANIPSLLR